MLFSHIPDLAVWVISKIGLISARYMYVLRRTTDFFVLQVGLGAVLASLGIVLSNSF